ncbi:MAG: inner membrane protein [Halocynthiibacter sp.]
MFRYFFVSEVVDQRRSYSRSAISSVGDEWGGPQTFTGPRLVVPVKATVPQTRRDPVLDPETQLPLKDEKTGEDRYKLITEMVTIDRAPIYVYPSGFDVEIDTKTQIRHRGIFQVPVYQGDMKMRFDFPADQIEAEADSEEDIQWDDARIELFLTSNKALRGVANLTEGAVTLPLEPTTYNRDNNGIVAQIGDPRKRGAYTLELGFNGASNLSIAPVGRDTSVVIRSDWAHPSFSGAFLPDHSDVSEKGFEAVWTIPHLARNLPQISRKNNSNGVSRVAFGLDFYQPNDFYQKAYRAGRYGILFIALTFLTIVLIEGRQEKPAHPVQYILVGLAQTIFVLLMVAYAEQFGFGIAYAISAGATIALLTLFGFAALKLGKRALVLGMMLVVLYAVLYLILRSADYALLAGSTLAFFALAVTMFATRNEEWYAPDGGGLFRPIPRPAPPAEPQASASASSDATPKPKPTTRRKPKTAAPK